MRSSLAAENAVSCPSYHLGGIGFLTRIQDVVGLQTVLIHDMLQRMETVRSYKLLFGLFLPFISQAAAITSGTVCTDAPVLVGDSGPSRCHSGAASASVSPSVTYFYNGFTISIMEKGDLNGKGTFQAWATIPVTVEIPGRSRPIVVVSGSGVMGEDIKATGATGQFRYGLSHRTVVTSNFSGQNNSVDWSAPGEVVANAGVSGVQTVT